MSGVAKELSAELLSAPDVTRISPEEAENLKKRQEALDKLLEEKNLAKYKLEVMFSHRHTSRAPTAGTVTWWESGTKLHGGGDAKLYLCDNSVPGSRYEGRGCGKFIPDSANGLSFIVCPHCQMMWKPEYLVGEIFYKLPLQKWAEVLHNWYMRMEGKADIYVKYGRMSVRDAQLKETEKKLQGELLTKARSIEQRSMYIYPLKNIIRDTSNGADLRSRILAFLSA
jgi:hypothetical protein